MNPDAQREMEQRALRNVRGLVDKIESSDELDARRQRKVVYWLLGGVAVLAIAVAVAVAVRTRGETVVIDPAKLPPVRGGPQR